MQKILIVEDEKKIREELERFLNNNGFVAVGLTKFDSVEDILKENADLILLDINLPYIDGKFMCKEIRKQSNVPIIMVTSRDTEIDELMSLNYGADQYVTKPYNIQILLLKITGLLKRTQGSEINQDRIKYEKFILNISQNTIEKQNKRVELTKNEFKIIHYLVLNKNKIVPREDIINYLWESESFIDDNTLTVNMKRLRDKLEELGILMTEVLLLMYDINIVIRIMITVILITLPIIAFIIEYYNKKHFYNLLKENMRELEEKYLIPEIINTPGFIEGKILKETIQDMGKSIFENVNKYKYLQEDYKEYIELWIHEIKLPISASKMVIENNKNEITKSIEEEMDRIENYIEQALFYARSNTVETDYTITKSNLQEIVNTSILKNKNVLIPSKIMIDLYNLEKEIYTDSKWISFILNQIVQNSIKYLKEENKKIEIYAEEKKENIILYIKDNGIGIKKGEITRVFEKGFTGENGRIIGKKSTGIGLYLCKKLCNKLGLGLELNSEKDIGTEVRIVFPKGSYMNI